MVGRDDAWRVGVVWGGVVRCCVVLCGVGRGFLFEEVVDGCFISAGLIALIWAIF